MNEENKQPQEETSQPDPEQETKSAPEPETEEKSEKKAKKKKEKYTFTREQVEQMELAAKQLESVKDQFIRQTAEYENYRKRTTKEKEGIYQDARQTPSRSSWRCMTIWNGPPPRAAERIPLIKRGWI